MNYISSTWLTAITVAGVLSTSAVSLADSRPSLTSPGDGIWFNKNDTLQFAGDAPGERSVELQMFDFETQQWAHSNEISTDDNGHFDTTYSVAVTGLPQLCDPGVTRDDGQRSNAVYFTVWGWGDTPQREPGHYVTTYETCGREGQQCCYHQENECDDGLDCGTRCSGANCGHDTCVPKKQSAPPQQPPSNPKPPQTPPPPPTPSPQGQWHDAFCECTDTLNFGNIGARCCALPSAGGEVFSFVLNAACSNSCSAIGMQLVQFTNLGPQPSLGTCNADAGSQCQIVPLR